MISPLYFSLPISHKHEVIVQISVGVLWRTDGDLGQRDVGYGQGRNGRPEGGIQYKCNKGGHPVTLIHPKGIFIDFNF